MTQRFFTNYDVPSFYLKHWTGEDGRLCEFSRPYDVVKAEWKTTRGTGQLWDLYTVTGLPPERRAALEDRFFRQADQAASDALDFMLANTSGTVDMPALLRSGWSRFVLSLIHRSPDGKGQSRTRLRAEMATRLPGIERDYQAQRQPSEPETFDEFRRLFERDAERESWAVLLERVIDSLAVGTFLNAMHWSIITIDTALDGAASVSLVTSDRPVCMTNGIDRPGGYVVLPVGPTRVFLAATSQDVETVLRQDNAEALHARLNDIVVRQAVRYVYGTDDRQLRFVANRLRKQAPL